MEKIRYPFVVRNKSVVIPAYSLPNAIDRVLLKHPNKFVKTTYARNLNKHYKTMDLINANKQAKDQSKKTKGQLIYVILDGEEFIVKNYDDVSDKDDVYSIWRDGAKYEDTKEEKQNEVETKTNKTMETKEKKSPAKKVAPKKAEKKAVAKKEKKTVAKKEKKVAEPKTKLGASSHFNAADMKKVEAILKKEDVSFNAWVNKLIFAKLG